MNWIKSDKDFFKAYLCLTTESKKKNIREKKNSTIYYDNVSDIYIF